MRVKRQRATKVTGAKNLSCRKCGHAIKTGEHYKKAKPRYGSPMFWCDNCVPRDSELTSSDKKSRLYEARENIEDLLATDDWTAEDVEQAFSDAADVANEVAGEYEEAAEAFQGGGPNGEMKELVEEWASELESFVVPDEDPDLDQEEWRQFVRDEADGPLSSLGV